MENKELEIQMIHEYNHEKGFARIVFIGVILGFLTMVIGVSLCMVFIINTVLNLITK